MLSTGTSTDDLLEILNPHSCFHCGVIRISDSDDPESFELRIPIRKVLAASQDGCTLFQAVLDALPAPRGSADSGAHLWLRLFGEKLCQLTFDWTLNGNPLKDDSFGYFPIFVSSDSQIADKVELRPLNMSPSSPQGLEFVRRCLIECRENHRTCRYFWSTTESDVRPSRILEIPLEDDGSIRLKETQNLESDLIGDYLALSYRWGTGVERGICTTDTLHDLEQGVQLSNLPRTIQDAVAVTRALGFRHIWIDRLCIIQDCEQDKSKEIRKMTDIYSNAYLLISAASAASCEDGFLLDRNVASAYGRVWLLPFVGRERTNQLLLCETELQNKKIEPIDERAWVYQEHFVSTRILRFGSRQIEWICCHGNKVDGGACGEYRLNSDPVFDERIEHRISYARRYSNKRDRTTNTAFHMKEWMDCVHAYSLRYLTKPSDRLPAFSAVAASFAKVMGWSPTCYFAGLWQDLLFVQLLWYPTWEGTSAKHAPEFSFYPKPSNPSHEPYSSMAYWPSWSWSSHRGPIAFCGGLVYNGNAELVGEPIIQMQDPENPFGRVKSGRLTVRSHIAACILTKLRLVHVDSNSRKMTKLCSINIRWDHEQPVASTCLHLLELDEYGHAPAGLVMQRLQESARPSQESARSSHEHVFRRLGIFRYGQDSDDKRSTLDGKIIRATYWTDLLPEDLRMNRRVISID